jgi:hypothetical protein
VASRDRRTVANGTVTRLVARCLRPAISVAIGLDKTLAGVATYASLSGYARALPILRHRGIRYMTLQGGEPLAHPKIVRIQGGQGRYPMRSYHRRSPWAPCRTESQVSL